MGLNFILGPASKNHQQTLLEWMQQVMKEDPAAKFYFIVPDHVKFGTEVNVLDYLRRQAGEGQQKYFADPRVQIYSFTRLAWYFLKDQPVYQVPRISQAGLNMIVTRILNDHNDELTLFKGERHQPGFVAKLADQMTELQDGNISSADVRSLLANVQQDQAEGTQSDLEAKLTDLAVVYAAFEKYIQDRYTNNFQILDVLADYLTSQDMSHAYFFFDKNYRFSAKEEKVIAAAMQQAAEVNVSLILDKPCPKAAPETGNIFAQSGRTYFRLYRLARDRGVSVRNIQAANDRYQNEDLLAVEKFWIQSTNGHTSAPERLAAGTIKVTGAESRIAEVRTVANRIKQLVALKGYHYNDFVILAPSMTLYENIVGPILRQAGIPFFIDLRQTMADHPLVELLTALFQIKERDYQYSDMMRLLKTELLIPRDPDADGEYMSRGKFRSLLDITENAILKYNFHGQKDWLRKKDWEFFYRKTTSGREQFASEKKVEKQINLVRHYIQKILPSFYKKLDQAENGRQAAQVLMEFLVRNGVAEQLAKWRHAADKEGDFDAANRPQEVWNTFVGMINEYVDNLGDKSFDSTTFLDLLQSGFAGTSYSQIPATLDQVVVSDSLQAQMDEQKVTFLMGMNEGAMPAAIKQEDLLTDKDREQLSAGLDDDQTLKSSSQFQMADQNFVAYQTFMGASQKLYISFPANDDNTKNLVMSSYVKRLCDHFGIQIQYTSSVPHLDEEKIGNYVGAKRLALTSLVEIARQAKNADQPLPKNWQLVYSLLLADQTPVAEEGSISFADLTAKLMASLDYQNIPEQLETGITRELYATKDLKENKWVLNTSISQLQEFYSNPYSYFLKYGLRLQEREVLEMSPAIRGTIFHWALQKLFDKLRAENRALKDISAEEFDAYMNEIMDQARQESAFQIMESSNRMRFISDKMARTAAHMGWNIHQQRQTSPFKTVGTEITYGQLGEESQHKGLSFDIAVPGQKEAYQVKVRGKVDRIDELDAGGKKFRTVIDYKSSDTKLDFGKVYAGIMLQLLTYLAFLQQESRLADPSQKFEAVGAYYMHIADPKLTLQKIFDKDQGKVSDEKLDQGVFSEHKYKGLMVDDYDFLDNIDSKLKEKESGVNHSVPFGLKGKYKKKEKKFEYYTGKRGPMSLLTLDQLDDLIKHDEEKIMEAAQAIFAGQIPLAPAKFSDNSTALENSDYKAVMRFDEMLRGNNYRLIQNMKLEQLLDTLRAEKSQEGEANGRH